MRKVKFAIIGLISFVVMNYGCGTTGTDILRGAETVLGESSGSSIPTNLEMTNGLKEALQVGVSKGADRVSALDGYFKNQAIKVLWPEEAKKVENTLRDLGLNKLCDDAILAFNRAAEDAAKEAKPIFVSAIKDMSIADAKNILLGADDAATIYFKNKTTAQLTAKFQPVIKKSLDKVEATKYWNDVMTRYNKIPFVEKVNPDIDAYVTERAIYGLFHMVEKEEKNIRGNLAARTSSLLKKVFGWAEKEKG